MVYSVAGEIDCLLWSVYTIGSWVCDTAKVSAFFTFLNFNIFHFQLKSDHQRNGTRVDFPLSSAHSEQPGKWRLSGDWFPHGENPSTVARINPTGNWTVCLKKFEHFEQRTLRHNQQTRTVSRAAKFNCHMVDDVVPPCGKSTLLHKLHICIITHNV